MERHYPDFVEHTVGANRPLPDYVHEEFAAYLRCGRLEQGFLRVRCKDCHAERLVAFSCKRRGFCPSCGARRMAEAADFLVDEVFPEQPVRQWVLSFPIPLRFLFASRPEVMSRVLRIVYRVISGHLIRRAGYTRKTGHTGAVTLIQRFGSALNLDLHFHMLFLDGVYAPGANGRLRFRQVKAPTSGELADLSHEIASRVGLALERWGLLERDAENVWLREAAGGDDPLNELLGHSNHLSECSGPQCGTQGDDAADAAGAG